MPDRKGVVVIRPWDWDEDGFAAPARDPRHADAYSVTVKKLDQEHMAADFRSDRPGEARTSALLYADAVGRKYGGLPVRWEDDAA